MSDINKGIQFNNTGNISFHGPVASGDHAQANQWLSVPEKEVHGNKKLELRILLLFANPFDTGRIYLEGEERVIKEALRRSKQRDALHLAACQATTLDDFRRALLDERPDVLHIGAHGNTNELILSNEQGYGQTLAGEQLAAYLPLYAQHLQCAIFNVCHSATMACCVSRSIKYAIAVEGRIADDVAIHFACGFYDALGAGETIERAYTEGVAAASMMTPVPLVLPELFCDGRRVSSK